MAQKDVFTLVNQQNGNLAFKLFSFQDNSHFDTLQQNNFYTIIWLQKGEALLKVDFSQYTIQENTLLSFAPFQPFFFSANDRFKGIAIQFHSDFYCIHRNPTETNCNTILFNNIYEAPFFTLTSFYQEKFEMYVSQLKTEVTANEFENYELLVPHLKILLVQASRAKEKSSSQHIRFADTKTPYKLQRLKDAIEIHYKEKHTASQYADLLNISPNALGKLVKTHYNKTLTHLIKERIIIQAKRELYMTRKTIKEIAWELGYADEFYFSRFFKNNTAISPQMYRDTVGFGKAELN
ncbi:AraC family transcriptional regulator [Dokdonia pacifica]|uniref:AraC-type DNA-binding protein n=1 Tax=Dokdonia pacifica TaxID=1627892 RepID=A0A239BB76_9FLAO|nr:helix-turn-helix domain-containing protein [Dokdonia pacifica]GGG30250.1 AraC family transcriptional regulator [Dokdonia pacifica]SNS05245.1 AraC-type DNA-binding protein [Dokdonia pacifica]